MKRRQSREELIRRMENLIPEMIRGSASITYEKCWWEGCSCRKGKLHGPYLSIVWKGDNGKTTGMYVRKGYVKKAFRAIKSWKDFMEVAKALADLNREEFLRGMTGSPSMRKEMREKGR